MLKTVSPFNTASPTFSGDVTLSTGNLVIGTAGKGIDFSADPGAAGVQSELLDDYEEGVWIPSLQFDTPGNSSFTYGYQLGYYTKVGRLVTVFFKIQLTAFSKGTGSGSLNVVGLPFTVGGGPEFPGSVALYDTPFSNIPIMIAIPNLPWLRFLTISNNAGWATFDDPDANSQYMASITYFV